MTTRIALGDTSGTRCFVYLVFSLVALFSFILFAPGAFAAGTGFEFIHFRIDSELDVIMDKSAVTITWTCNAETSQGIVTDNTASESDGGTLDGIVKVASTSAENGASGADCDSGDTITASTSVNGWVTRVFTGTVAASTSTDPFVITASMDYNFVVNGTEDELDNALTLDGTTASISYSGTTASASYSSGKRYLAITDSGGTLTGGADGYVNQTVTLTGIVNTASQAGDFGLSATSGNDGSGLPFALKATLNVTSRSGVTEAKPGATVTAGDSLGVSCTDNSDGKYYCAIPLSHTATSVQGVASGYDTNTGTYTDRTAGGDAQSTVTFALAESAAGGGVAPTPTPTPTPEVSPTPTPAVSPEVTPTPTPIPSVVKLYRKVSDPKVYFEGDDGLLRWVKTLEDFNNAGYKWEDVQVISGPEFAQLKKAMISAVKLIRKANNPKVYSQREDGKFVWIKTLKDFNNAGYKWEDVELVSDEEFTGFSVAGNIKIVPGIRLNVRLGPGIGNKKIGKLIGGQEVESVGRSGVWHKIRFENQDAWVHGDYVTEL